MVKAVVFVKTFNDPEIFQALGVDITIKYIIKTTFICSFGYFHFSILNPIRFLLAQNFPPVGCCKSNSHRIAWGAKITTGGGGAFYGEPLFWEGGFMVGVRRPGSCISSCWNRGPTPDYSNDILNKRPPVFSWCETCAVMRRDGSGPTTPQDSKTLGTGVWWWLMSKNANFRKTECPIKVRLGLKETNPPINDNFNWIIGHLLSSSLRREMTRLKNLNKKNQNFD